MEYQKIINLIGKTIDSTKLPKFTTRKRIEKFDQSNGSYNVNKDIRFKTPQLRSDLRDFNDGYIVVTGKITAKNPGNDENIYNRKLALKNNAPLFNLIFKANNQLIEDVQDLDIVMPMHNFSGYNNDNNERKKIFYPIKDAESFNYKTKLVGKSPDGENELEDIKDINIVVPLKHLS